MLVMLMNGSCAYGDNDMSCIGEFGCGRRADDGVREVVGEGDGDEKNGEALSVPQFMLSPT